LGDIYGRYFGNLRGRILGGFFGRHLGKEVQGNLGKEKSQGKHIEITLFLLFFHCVFYMKITREKS